MNRYCLATRPAADGSCYVCVRAPHDTGPHETAHGVHWTDQGPTRVPPERRPGSGRWTAYLADQLADLAEYARQRRDDD